MLQLFIYAWLAWKNELSEPERLQPCIMPFRSEKEQPFRITRNKQALQFNKDLLEEFEQHLGIFIAGIIDPELPFAPTPEVENCRYCAYTTICNR